MTKGILDVVIVGGGLSGTCVGFGLLEHKLEWVLLEASDRHGGRLLNAPNTTIDVGGAWMWPEYQPHLRNLVSTLSLVTFSQPGDVHATRIEGGAVQLVESLSQRIQVAQITNKGVTSSNTILLNCQVNTCKLLLREDDFPRELNPLVQLETTNGTTVLARKVVFAIPPKLLSATISFEPPLSRAKQAAMLSSHTWMAGVTKVVLMYTKRFWSLESLNGVFSKSKSTGSLAFQVYDSGPSDDSVAALTFFSHIPPESPAQIDDDLVARTVADQIAAHWIDRRQLAHANLAHSYQSYHVYRWPNNPFISGNDSKPVHIYPHPTPSRELAASEWNDALLFAGTETDLVAPGVMEGAVGAAKRVLEALLG